MEASQPGKRAGPLSETNVWFVFIWESQPGKRAFSYPELRSSWPAPRIESSGKSQFCSPRFADFRSTAQPQGLENVERKWLGKGVLIYFTKL